MINEEFKKLLNDTKKYIAGTQNADWLAMCLQKTKNNVLLSDMLEKNINDKEDNKFTKVIGYITQSKPRAWNSSFANDYAEDISHDPERQLRLKIYSVQAMEVIDAALKHIFNDFEYFKYDKPFASNMFAKSSPRFFFYDHMTELGEFFLVKEHIFYNRDSSVVKSSTKYSNVGIDFVKLAVESYRCKCIAEVKFKEIFDDFTLCAETYKQHIIAAERIIRYWEGNATKEDKKFIGRPLNPFEQGRLQDLIEQRNKANGAADVDKKLDVIKTFFNEID